MKRAKKQAKARKSPQRQNEIDRTARLYYVEIDTYYVETSDGAIMAV
ncbi:MAG: hypothetical protein OXT03_05515 [Alphaproteobacteria bacterium]|nr:hypothetical protein [Alphaproteobacteria bacterium]